MRILFSPVGTADPMTMLGDGPMLHIARHFRPDKVVLFLSPKMAEYEKNDSRYSKAVKSLARAQGGVPVQLITEFSKQTEPHRYDFYIEEFAKLLGKLNDDNPGAEILVNVSSGTPAMQAALVAFDAFDRLGLRAIQVATPKGDINAKGDREDPDNYDFDALWELNPDNDANVNRASRCLEIESAHFKDLILRDNICALIENYDYVAAHHLAMQLGTLSPRLCELIEGCARRLNLDGQNSAKIFAGTQFSYDPGNQLREYLSMLEVRLKCGQWADFVRAVTPAITETALKLLEDLIPRCRYLAIENNAYCLIPERICRDERLSRALGLDKKPPQPGFHPYLNNDHLVSLLVEYCEDARLVEKITILRRFEVASRNRVAHQISRIDKDWLEKDSEGNFLISLEQVLSTLFELNGLEQNLYDDINKEIILQLS